MNMTWDLDILYKGYDDPKYNNDLEKVEKLIEKIKECSDNLDSTNQVESIKKTLKLEEEITKETIRKFLRNERQEF